jgi:S1-C subfamily serine protease
MRHFRFVGIFLLASVLHAQKPLPSQTGVSLTKVINQIRSSVVQIQARIEYNFVHSQGESGNVMVVPLGSGFFADTTYHVITARHVIDSTAEIPQQLLSQPVGPQGPIDPQSIHVQLLIGLPTETYEDKTGTVVAGNFSPVPSESVRTSPSRDIGIISISRKSLEQVLATPTLTVSGHDLKPLTPRMPQFAQDTSEEGEMIAISGFPLRIPTVVTTVGWVGSKHARAYPYQGDLQLGSIQVNHGNSGGPVYRVRDGAVIGIAKGYWSDTTTVIMSNGATTLSGEAA